MTRNDVARQAGVSTAVVSYVVNDGPKPVAPETAARVRDAISLLDYRPNPSARALRKGRTDILGLVLADADNPYYVEYASAISTEAYQRGHALMIASVWHNQESEKLLVEDLLARQVDGIIAASAFKRPGELFFPSWHTPPVVMIDAPVAAAGFAAVGLDGAQGARLAVEHLVRVHGHRRIGIIVGDRRDGREDPRETGWREALRTAGLSEGPIARTTWTRDGGYEAGRLLLEADDAPTAVFACSDLLAVGLLRAGHERGLALPGNLAVVSFDGTKEAEFSWPALTVVAQPIAEMARAAVLLALDPARPTSFTQFQGTLVVRRSCGCVVG